MPLVDRFAKAQLDELASELRIVIVSGPRQSGKTTLLRQFAQENGGYYRTLDDEQTLRTAKADPQTFVNHGQSPRLIDEVQRAGDEFVRAIKMVVDENTAPGQFVLSGSSNFLTIPTLSESLAGRVAFVELWQLGMAERTGDAGDFVERAFADPRSLVGASTWRRDQYIDVIVRGGYPEPLTLKGELARRSWYDGYITTIINRDIKNFADIANSDAIPRLLGLIAAHAGGISVTANLARGVDLARQTTRDYLSYLDTVYLTTRVPAWSTKANSRLTKSPKLYLTDSGLAANLLNVTTDELAEPGHPLAGQLLKTFTAAELRKAVTYSSTRSRLSHLRTNDGREVDFVLEGPGGKLIAIELKASASPGTKAIRNLRWLREQLGDQLHAGILLHLGNHGDSYGDGIYSLPLSILWGHSTLPA